MRAFLQDPDVQHSREDAAAANSEPNGKASPQPDAAAVCGTERRLQCCINFVAVPPIRSAAVHHLRIHPSVLQWLHSLPPAPST